MSGDEKHSQAKSVLTTERHQEELREEEVTSSRNRPHADQPSLRIAHVLTHEISIHFRNGVGGLTCKGQ